VGIALEFGMKTPGIHLAEQLTRLRKARGLTQQGLADALQLTRSAIGAYEEGRAEPKLATLATLAQYFGASLDALILGTQEADPAAHATGAHLRVLTVPTASDDRERVAVVPVRAAAGYLRGYGDPEYMGNLPTFALPLKEVSSEATYRLFQIEGDSMLPIPSGSYILSTYQEDWTRAGGMRPYIVVTRTHGIVFKRLENRLDTHGDWLFLSDNPDFAPFTAGPDEVVEVWRAVGYIAFHWPTPAFSGMERIQVTLDQVREDVKAIRQHLPPPARY
jgi:transcriptional regulator with XRE-family HTH domain